MESKESESNTGFQFIFNFLVQSHRATNILNFQSTLPRDATLRYSCSCSLHAYSHHYRSKKRRRAAARNIVSADETFARHERLPDPSGVNEETRHRSSRAERNNFKRRVEGRVSKISRCAVNGFLFSSPSPPLLFFFSFQGHVSGRLPARHLLFLRFEISRHDSSHCYRLSGDKRGDLDPESRERIRTCGADESRRFHTSNISR